MFFSAGTGSDLLITFSHANFPQDGTFWGQSVAEKSGKPMLAFVEKTDQWYPKSAMVSGLIAAKPILDQFERRITIGTSKGGYAALKYSRALQSDLVIAAAPQMSIEPAVVGEFDTRFAYAFVDQLHEGMRVEPGDVAGKIVIIVDPHLEVDVRNLALILKAIPGPAIVNVPWLGHAAFAIFSGTDRLMSLIDRCWAEDFAGLDAEVRQDRRKLWWRAMALIEAVHKRRPALGLRIMEAHRHVIPASQLAAHFLNVAYGAQREGDYQAALRDCKQALELEPSSVEAASLLAALDTLAT